MEPIHNIPGTTKCLEVLYFDEAEVTKMRGGKPSFATFGPMSVLYCPSYNRFLLQINDWRYPLMRRSSINASGSGNYCLPGPNGATFDLKISKPGQALGNLDALLEGTRKLAASPDDKLARAQKKMHTETGPKEVIGQTIKQVVTKIQNKVATAKTGTKHLTSTSKRVNLKDIKNKNFRRDAHSKLKKDFFAQGEKLTHEFNEKRKGNANLNQSRQYEDLRKTSNAAVFYVPQLEVEDAIINMKEMGQAPKTEAKLGGERRIEREVPQVQGVDKTLVPEHYQG